MMIRWGRKNIFDSHCNERKRERCRAGKRRRSCVRYHCCVCVRYGSGETAQTTTGSKSSECFWKSPNVIDFGNAWKELSARYSENNA